MYQLLSEVLKFAELEHAQTIIGIPEELKKLVIPCEGEGNFDYYAVDSGYLVRRISNIDVLVQSIVAVGKDIKRRFYIRRIGEDPHIEARKNELQFAETLDAEVILVDGPITPYANITKVVGVSKDPRLIRYGPRIPDKDKREIFVKLAKSIGEREVASVLLAQSPPGSYLVPVDLGGLYGTFFKSDWVLYVEFPKNLSASYLCPLFRRYPIRLRLAHRLAKINRQYLRTVGLLVSRILSNHTLQPRETL
ncbi:conserved hypothetical protein [Pyrobaculum islandicum DSM 4184]|uniref:NurA domain-containing protein n=1 Tax=Pyrobaculum islandicum (strain DSM 4184 / JCM 9189 / GEO3) TaxID=384616 RepID=A1RT91_PYRIL|nr:DNA double-strand break repair nuclease NurA [Pyrobaculum islandicum]ABL88173.1 conserved hypothetical protein [Pyrobaculum islandicum DSM 4184]